MVKGLVSNVRSRRKEGTGLVVALSRSVDVPDACEVVAAFGALGSLEASGALGVPGVRRILRVLTYRSCRREVRVCHFGNHTQMTTAAVRRVHGGVATVRTACRQRIQRLEPRLGRLSDCVGEGLQIVAAWFHRVRIRRDAHNLPAPGSRQTVTVHLTQVVAVRFGIRRKRTDDCRGVGVYIGEGGDRRLSAVSVYGERSCTASRRADVGIRGRRQRPTTATSATA